MKLIVTVVVWLALIGLGIWTMYSFLAYQLFWQPVACGLVSMGFGICLFVIPLYALYFFFEYIKDGDDNGIQN